MEAVRFWLIDLPALIVTFAFRAYAVFLAAMALICFGLVIAELLRLVL